MPYMKTKFFSFTLLALFVLISPVTKAIEDDDKDPKHVLKLNLGALSFTNLSLQYEQAFHKNFSFAVQGGYLLTRGIPERFLPKGGDFADFSVSGVNCSPELRFYPGKKVKRKAPRGFYIAPYGRLAKYTVTASFMFSDSSSMPVQDVPVDFKASYSGIGGGLMFGAQFIIAKRVSIDWWILGGHFGVSKLKGEMKSDVIYNNQYSFYDALENANVPFGTKTFSVEGDKATISISGLPFGGIRSGFCLGFAF
jgi:hypothetical protein